MRAPSAGCPASLQGSRRFQQGGSREVSPPAGHTELQVPWTARPSLSSMSLARLSVSTSQGKGRAWGLPARCACRPHWAADHAVTAMQTMLADLRGSHWLRLTMAACGGQCCSHQSCSADLGVHNAGRGLYCSHQSRSANLGRRAEACCGQYSPHQRCSANMGAHTKACRASSKRSC